MTSSGMLRHVALVRTGVPPKRLFLQERHSVTSQKTAFFMIFSCLKVKQRLCSSNCKQTNWSMRAVPGGHSHRTSFTVPQPSFTPVITNTTTQFDVDPHPFCYLLQTVDWAVERRLRTEMFLRVANCGICATEQ
jgi:hypothetical protein